MDYDYKEILRQQFNEIVEGENLDVISGSASEISQSISDNFTLDKLLEATLNGQSIFQNTEIIEDMFSLLMYEVRTALVLGSEILAICIISGLLKCVSDSFRSRNVAHLTCFICNMIITGLAISSFTTTYNLAVDTVSVMTSTMLIITPVLITILAATGMITSGTILSPLVTAVTTGFGMIIKKLILPALFAATILCLINCLTEKDYVNKLAKLLRSAAVFATGLIVTVMTGVITVQGMLSESSDGLLINAAKYSLNTFIPLVGGFTSDTVELYLRCMGSIRSIIGVFGILMLSVMLLIPILKILAVALIYKMVSAFAEPVTEKKLSDGLNEMGNSMISICSVMFFTSLLFILFISIIVNIGG